jgi:gliding motility-associated-like protein
VLFLVFFAGKTSATHIVGGEMYYDFIGGSAYKVTLKLYRDCINGQAPFDGQNGAAAALLHIFNASGNLVQQLDMGVPVVTNVPPSINNPCIQTPGGICVEEGKYVLNVTLPPLAGGYKLVYQRCCRNNSILNIVTPGGTGSSYQAFIPGPELALTNSSPRYNNFPQIFICNGLNITFDHKATDPDGDVLVYSLCSPFNGLDGCCPIITIPAMAPGSSFCNNPPAICPTVAAAPPYAFVNFVPPYSGSYPIASNPSLAINSSSGFLNGKPNINGQWVVGICVEEWRNGNLLSTHYRDFQFNVVTCSVTVVSAVADQPSKCQGDTINFVNNSFGATSFHWNFGINEIFSDTSNAANPTYVYPDTGVYNVTLIANPGKPCADTVKKPFYIYPRLNIGYIPQSVQCLKNNNFNFNVFGSYINSATFNWSFGAAATPSTSNIKDPANVKFTQPGKYFVKVVGKQYTCIDSFIDSVRILARPTAIINNFPTTLCDPGKISFSNGSVSEFPGAYLWSFSDSTYSYEYQPTKIFSPAGIYSASLTLFRGAPCPDTSQTSVNTITVNPVPTAYYVATPTVTSIFEPNISFINASTADAIKFNYDFGDGEFSDFMNEIHTYRVPRTYTVIQTVYNKFGCLDKHSDIIKIEPEFRFFIPNTFTPDENNLNDIFKPITIGVSEFSFDIFDRWGHQVYSGNDIEKGWDGKLKGKACKQDVYVWKISYLNEVTRRYEIKTGHVLLLQDSGEF